MYLYYWGFLLPVMAGVGVGVGGWGFHLALCYLPGYRTP